MFAAGFRVDASLSKPGNVPGMNLSNSMPTLTGGRGCQVHPRGPFQANTIFASQNLTLFLQAISNAPKTPWHRRCCEHVSEKPLFSYHTLSLLHVRFQYISSLIDCDRAVKPFYETLESVRRYGHEKVQMKLQKGSLVKIISNSTCFLQSSLPT